MHPGQMVGLAIILDREFPVATNLEGESGVAASGYELRPSALADEGRDAPPKRLDMLRKSRGIAAQVDEQHTEKLGAAHLFQAVVGGREPRAGVLVHAADVGRRLELAAERVGPAVIAAGDERRHLGGL